MSVFTGSDFRKNRKKKFFFKKNLFWKKIQIFCQILNDEISKANLGLSLIKEDKNFNDDDFLSILDNLIYKEDIDGSQFQNINKKCKKGG